MYTTALPVEQGTEHEVLIEQLSPISGEPQAPLVASTIKDFGPVGFNEDKTFTASVSFCEAGGGTDSDGGGSDSGRSGTAGGASGGVGGIKALPATGGALPTAGLAGAVLVAGGLLARRVLGR